MYDETEIFVIVLTMKLTSEKSKVQNFILLRRMYTLVNVWLRNSAVHHVESIL